MRKHFLIALLASVSTFASAQDPAKYFPMDFFRHIYLNVTVEGREAHFILDTGSPYSFPDSTFVAREGLQYKNMFKARMGGTGNGKATVPVINNEFTYSMGGRQYKSKISPVIQLKEILGDYADGLVGLSEVGNAAIAIDFRNGRIGFWNKIETADL